jgi:hypothetical protein
MPRAAVMFVGRSCHSWTDCYSDFTSHHSLRARDRVAALSQDQRPAFATLHYHLHFFVLQPYTHEHTHKPALTRNFQDTTQQPLQKPWPTAATPATPPVAAATVITLKHQISLRPSSGKYQLAFRASFENPEIEDRVSQPSRSFAAAHAS